MLNNTLENRLGNPATVLIFCARKGLYSTSLFCDTGTKLVGFVMFLGREFNY